MFKTPLCLFVKTCLLTTMGFFSPLVAYAQPSTGQMANCPLFYELPATSTGCGDQSQAATVLHEFTHVLAGTSDYAYGYSRSTSLSASQAIDNADK